MKECIVCKLTFPFDAFPFKHKAKNTRRSYCYECQRNYSRAHYLNNRELYNARRYRRQRLYRARNRERLTEYITGRSCVDCAESDVRVLEFDHVRGTKRGNISEMVLAGVAWRRIEEELAKCEVRCANCHRRKTALQFGWFRIINGT